MNDRNMLELLIGIRGGLPENCDFCDLPYNEERHPEPEEAGAWACADAILALLEQTKPSLSPDDKLG